MIFLRRRSSPHASRRSLPHRSTSRILRLVAPIWKFDSMRTSPCFRCKMETALILVRATEKNGSDACASRYRKGIANDLTRPIRPKFPKTCDIRARPPCAKSRPARMAGSPGGPSTEAPDPKSPLKSNLLLWLKIFVGICEKSIMRINGGIHG